MLDMKKILSATVAVSLIGCLAAGCAKEEADPSTAPSQTTASVDPTQTTAPIDPEETTAPADPQQTTSPTTPGSIEETMVEHSHLGLTIKLGESYTTKVAEDDPNTMIFQNGDIQGTVEHGTVEELVGKKVASSQEAANHLLSQMPDVKDAWIGSSTGVCFYLVTPVEDGVRVQGVYLKGDQCWKVTAESSDPADQDVLIYMVARCNYAAG